MKNFLNFIAEAPEDDDSLPKSRGFKPVGFNSRQNQRPIYNRGDTVYRTVWHPDLKNPDFPMGNPPEAHGTDDKTSDIRFGQVVHHDVNHIQVQWDSGHLTKHDRYSGRNVDIDHVSYPKTGKNWQITGRLPIDTTRADLIKRHAETEVAVEPGEDLVRNLDPAVTDAINALHKHGITHSHFEFPANDEHRQTVFAHEHDHEAVKAALIDAGFTHQYVRLSFDEPGTHYYEKKYSGATPYDTKTLTISHRDNRFHPFADRRSESLQIAQNQKRINAPQTAHNQAIALAGEDSSTVGYAKQNIQLKFHANSIDRIVNPPDFAADHNEPGRTHFRNHIRDVFDQANIPHNLERGFGDTRIKNTRDVIHAETDWGTLHRTLLQNGWQHSTVESDRPPAHWDDEEMPVARHEYRKSVPGEDKHARLTISGTQARIHRSPRYVGGPQQLKLYLYSGSSTEKLNR